jgi:hypothetical protein
MSRFLMVTCIGLILLLTTTAPAQQGHDHSHGPGGHSHGDADGGGGNELQILPLVLLGIGLIAVITVVGMIALRLRRAKAEAPVDDVLAPIDVTALPHSGPPASGPQLSVYNIPVRLVLLVLAPVGRGGKIPPNEFLPAIVDALTPQLMQVLAAHGTQFRRWPAQISSQGFSQVFFQNAPLPGDAGKGTPWCALAGRFDTPAGPMLAGLVLHADAPNSLSQIAITQPGQWLDVLRVKTAK